MKILVFGLALSLSTMASTVTAQRMLTIDGQEYELSALLENCQSMSDDPVAQITCLNDISAMLEEQSEPQEEVIIPVPEALEALRAAAQYSDKDTGLSVLGSDCNIQTVYYGNYFHISRRNISAIDLFSAQFDASQLEYDQIIQAKGGQPLLSQGVMTADATALTHGGVGLESSQQNFAPRSPRAELDAYAIEVVGQLSGAQGQTFDFVLVHPQRSQDSAEIWSAFEDFVGACKK